MSVLVPWILGATAKRYAGDSPIVAGMDDFGYYPVTARRYVDELDTEVQVMRGSKATMITIPVAVYRQLRTGGYVADEG